MENHLSVRETRRQLAEVLNTAAFGDHRIVVVRYRQEVGAFVSMNDLEFRRYRPGAELSPSAQSLRQDEFELKGREDRLAHREAAGLEFGTPERRSHLAAERELLVAERRRLEVLLALQKRSSAAPKN